MIAFWVVSCDDRPEKTPMYLENWAEKKIDINPTDSLETGSTYLSVCTRIYSSKERRTYDLTATISMRNTSEVDSIYILKANYFDTKGKRIKTYLDKPIFLAPLETVGIVIEEIEKEGGFGANFIFDWGSKKQTTEPLFESIMISTSGQQGLSFTTQGKRIK